MGRLLRGATAQTLLLTIMPLTFILGMMSFGSVYLHHHAMRELIAERDLRAAVAISRMIASQIEQRRTALQSIIDDAPVDLSGATARQFPDGLAHIAADGSKLATSGPVKWMVDARWGRATLQRAGSGTAVVVDNGMLFLVARSPDGTALIAHVRPESLSLNALLAQPFAQNDLTSVVLFDQDSHVVFAMGALRETGTPLIHAGVREALAGSAGVLFRPDTSGGMEHVVAFAPIHIPSGATGLGLFIEEPWETVVDPVMRYSLAVPLITVPVLVLAALAVAFGLRRIVQPLQRLGAEAEKVGAGEFGALHDSVGGIDEIAQLQAALATMADRIEADQDRLRGYANAVVQTQETERARLARELHDGTIQSLIFVSQRAQRLRIEAARMGSSFADGFDELRAKALQLVDEVRRLSRALRPIYLDQVGLAASLDRLVCEVNESIQQTGTRLPNVCFEAVGDVPRLAPDIELALFRIAQEALNNVVRHACATRADITLAAHMDGIILEIRDDGKGFDSTALALQHHRASSTRSGGYGLIDIRERGAACGARVEITSARGHGSSIRVSLPAKQSVPTPPGSKAETG